MNLDFMVALDGLLDEKNIDKEELLQAIESSIAASYQKNYKNKNEVKVRIDRETGEIMVFETKTIVDEVTDPNTEISLEKALEKDPAYQVGDLYQTTLNPKDFGRIAALNAKQLIFQKIKEAEKHKIYDEYCSREGELLNGVVSRVDRGNVFIDIGGAEALLPPSEQIPTDNYEHNKRFKVYLLNVRRTPKGPQLKVSRSHPELVKRLFEEEVPEINEGRIDIIDVSREPGYRSKISVKSNEKGIDAVGSCVGQKGTRVQAVIDEIGTEKIDVVEFSQNDVEYLKSALSPAKIEKVLANHTEKSAIAVVDDFQLSLAIGKEGQNVRLAAKLTGWKIDIKSKSAFNQLLKDDPEFLENFMLTDKASQDLIEEDIPDLILDDDDFKSNDEELESIDEIVEKDNDILLDLFEQ